MNDRLNATMACEQSCKKRDSFVIIKSKQGEPTLFLSIMADNVKS